MKNKIINILKYISLSLIGGLLFFIPLLFLNTQAASNDISTYNSFKGATCKLYNNNNFITSDVLSDSDIDNCDSISLSIMPNIDNYVNNLGVTTYLDLEIELTVSINSPCIVQFYGSSILDQNISLFNNGVLIDYFTTYDADHNNTIINTTAKIYNRIVITFYTDELGFYIAYSYDATSYLKGYNQALFDVDFDADAYHQLQNDYNVLLNSYNSLEEQYNTLASGEYTFENLFWSIGSVPMAVLLQTFNVNVLGLNIAAIITGILTALVIIWLIKKLFK